MATILQLSKALNPTFCLGMADVRDWPLLRKGLYRLILDE